MSGRKHHLVNREISSSEAARRLVLPVAPTIRTGSTESPDPHARALSEVRTHVAKTLYETVMQTLAATTYLAESPTIPRSELVRHLRQATHELRCVIDNFAASEAGNGCLGPMEPSMARATEAG